ncbi:uncharacterized protein LOC112455119 isoform X1 [Temnothorax curvispinosus]|uniref:Uncharacterized protein LOC112455119 isoform X1 n=1 Tax=Temnothorax curvispinosus TaxID=300111 RepID=A0A6J1PTI9_9HYME|nr:uncharacterized protein LOC112455119 isoform X1 [Temnothorax curvispinosus]XP_024872613.1 uncharacterized protein LOC112455119 isoform X1 [Temnothorax curvispinosus]XP_024872614.1 uncharacterized protein LOC112455119 isoform X1 [Temnothorax curvispinosus]XP_024872615.1 uncharacterized protein LOC112455119 isoform X1 [Temnothorax curvispinosus]XP_024872616.1 uncharacterized protein LOC112455119 isoform X1 [Temnothorax curvispinosus]
MQKIAVMAAVQRAHGYHNGSNAYGDASNAPPEHNGSSSTSRSGRFDADLHGNVNILLGGAMISGVIMMVVLICYCCHKNVRKHRPQEYSQYWRAEPDIHSLEVFTMDTHCIERSATSQVHQEEGVPTSLPPCPVTSGPPPAYESLIFDPRALPSPTDKKDESDDPGSIISPPISSLPTESEANRINKREDIPRDDQGLPSYEAALKLEADGYV